MNPLYFLKAPRCMATSKRTGSAAGPRLSAGRTFADFTARGLALLQARLTVSINMATTQKRPSRCGARFRRCYRRAASSLRS
jgi:hypothetical protein